jgi:hypothetical protein
VTVQVRLVPLTTYKHWSSSGEDSAPVMRRRRFESDPVLSIFDNLVIAQRTHDVAAAYLLAMQKVPVRLRLGAFRRRVGKLGIPRASGARDRRFKSGHADSVLRWDPCWYG